MYIYNLYYRWVILSIIVRHARPLHARWIHAAGRYAALARSLTTFYPDTRQEHHPAAPHACALPPRQRPQRLPRPSPRRPRTRFLPRATRPHSPNPHLRRWTILANLPIARPTALPVPLVRRPPYPRFGFSLEPVS